MSPSSSLENSESTVRRSRKPRRHRRSWTAASRTWRKLKNYRQKQKDTVNSQLVAQNSQAATLAAYRWSSGPSSRLCKNEGAYAGASGSAREGA